MAKLWAKLAVLAGLVGVTAAFWAPIATASPGDVVAVIAPPEMTVGVSVAFDGANLYYTNGGEGIPGDGRLHRVAPRGNPVTTHVSVPIVGVIGEGINAISYDATRDLFWGVSGGENAETPAGFTLLYHVYTLTRDGIARLAFVIDALQLPGQCKRLDGCERTVDGWAYDATTDSLWFSPDGTRRVYHFDAVEPIPVDMNGTTIPAPTSLRGFFDIEEEGSMAPCPETNSGVAAGAGFLYLMNGNCNIFFRYSKQECTAPFTPDEIVSCPGNRIDEYTYVGTRAEDGECDDVTFRVNVVWIRDFSDSTLTAYELPVGSCIHGGGVEVEPDWMTGGGWLASAQSSNGKVTFGFMDHCRANELPNRFQVNWNTGEHFHLTQLIESRCFDGGAPPFGQPVQAGEDFDTVVARGIGRLNGVDGAEIRVTFTDNGEPGSSLLAPSDHGHIEIDAPGGAPVLTVDGPLVGGNAQAHPGA